MENKLLAISIKCDKINELENKLELVESNNQSLVSKIKEFENKLNLVESNNNYSNNQLLVNKLENKLLGESKLKIFDDFVYMGIENNSPLFINKNVEKLKIDIFNDFMLKQIEQLPKLTEIEIASYDTVSHIMTNIDYHKIVIAHSNIQRIRFGGGGANSDRCNMPMLICPKLEVVYNIGLSQGKSRHSLYNIQKDMLFCAFIGDRFARKEYFLIKNDKIDYYKKNANLIVSSVEGIVPTGLWMYNTTGAEL